MGCLLTSEFGWVLLDPVPLRTFPVGHWNVFSVRTHALPGYPVPVENVVRDGVLYDRSEGFALTGYVVPGCVEDGAWMLWEDSSDRRRRRRRHPLLGA